MQRATGKVAHFFVLWKKKTQSLRTGSSSPRQTRTADRVVNSHLLYRLSYQGMNICNVLVSALLVNIFEQKKVRVTCRHPGKTFSAGLSVELSDNRLEVGKLLVKLSLALCLCDNPQIGLRVGLADAEPPGGELDPVAVEVHDLGRIHR